MTSNTAAANALVDALAAHGVTFDNVTTTKAAIATVFNNWIDETSTAGLSLRVSSLVSLIAVRDQNLSDWALGTINGGPDSDGVYPINIQGGGSVDVKCPARLEFDAAGFRFKGSKATTGALPSTGNQLGDTWVVTANNHLWSWSDALSWVDLGVAGAPGATGPATEWQVSGGNLQYRAVGGSSWTTVVAMSTLKGADGLTVRHGAGVPDDASGVDGDFYIDTTATAIYGPKAAGHWGSATSIIGVTGPAGVSAGVLFTYSTTTTDSDPGGGNLRFNNATLASVDKLLFDNTERGGANVTAWLDGFGASNNPGSRGEITVTQIGDPTKFVVFDVTGSTVDGTGYRKALVSYLTGPGGFANGAVLAVSFTRAGNKGTDGAGAGDVTGPATNLDNAIPQWNGANSKALKAGRAIGVASSTDIPDRAAADARYQQLVALLTSIAGLAYVSGRYGVTVTASGVAALASIGAVNSGDLLDRAAGDGRYQLSSQRNVANGYAPLGSDGKVPTTNLPDAVLGALEFQGLWNATTNSPSIPAAAAGNKGWFYIVQTGGTTSVGGVTDWQPGDWLVSTGANWYKVDSSDQVVSVAGQVGAISKPSLIAAISGTASGDLVKLAGPAQLPALDASLLTGLPSAEGATLIASGAISTGQLIALRTDGKVEVVSSTGVAGSAGTPVAMTAHSANGQTPAAVFNPTSGKIVVAYEKSSNGKLCLIVGSVSGTTISFGTELDTGLGVGGLAMASFSTAAKVLVCRDAGTSLLAFVATISGTSISIGSEITVDASVASGNACAVEDIASGKFLLSYVVSGNTGCGVYLLSVSGTTVSNVGSVGLASSGSGIFDSCMVYSAAAGKSVAVFRDVGASNCKSYVITVSGTSITAGAVTNLPAATSPALGYDGTAAKPVLAYQSSGLKYVVGTISGTTITWSAATTIDAATTALKVFLLNDTFMGGVGVYYAGPSPSYFGKNVLVKVAGGVGVAGTIYTYRSAAMNSGAVALDTAAHKYVTIDPTADVAVVSTPDNLVTNAVNWIGIAQQTVADAAPVRFAKLGDVASGLSGLTPRTDYYANGDATLSATATAFGKVGRALTATTLIVTDLAA